MPTNTNTQQLLVQIRGDISNLQNSINNAQNLIRGMNQSVRQSQQQVNGLTDSFGNLGTAIKGALSGAAVVKFTKSISDLFISADKGTNLMKKAFGLDSSRAINWSENFSKATGTYVGDAQKTIAITKIMADNMSAFGDESAKVAQEVAVQASNIASSIGGNFDTIAGELMSAIRGEAEAVEKYGISMSETAMQQYLYANNIKYTWGQLDEQSKAQYRLVKLLEDTQAFQNTSTQESYNNSLLQLTATIKQMAISIGNVLIPFLWKVAEIIKNAIGPIVNNLLPAFELLGRFIYAAAFAISPMIVAFAGLIGWAAPLIGIILSLIGVLKAYALAQLVVDKINKLVEEGMASFLMSSFKQLSVNKLLTASNDLLSMSKMYLGMSVSSLRFAFKDLISTQLTWSSVSLAASGVASAFKYAIMGLTMGFTALASAIIGPIMLVYSFVQMIKSFKQMKAANKQMKDLSKTTKKMNFGKMLKNVKPKGMADKLKKSGSNANKQAKKNNKDQKQIEEEYNRQIEDLLKERYEKYLNAQNLFNGIDREVLGGNNLIKAIQEQVDAVKDWDQAMGQVGDKLTDLVQAGIISPSQKEEILKTLRDLGPEYVDEIQALANMTSPQFTEWANYMVEKMNIANKLATEEVAKMAPDIKKQIEADTPTLQDAGAGAAGALGDATAGGIGDINLDDSLGDLATDIADTFQDNMVDSFRKIATGGVIGGVLGAALGAIFTFNPILGAAIGAAAGSIAGAFWEDIKIWIADGNKKFEEDLRNKILQVIDTSFWFYNKGYELIEGFKNGINNAKESLSTTIAGLKDTTLQKLSDAKSWLYNKGTEIVDGLRDGMHNVKNNISTKAGEIKTWALNGIGTVTSLLYSKGQEIGNSVRNGINDKASYIKSKAGEIKGWVTGQFGSASTLLHSVGKNIVQGLWNGMDSLKSWLKEKVSGLAGWLPKWVKDKLGIHSPSRVFMALGDFSAQGLVNGFEDGVQSLSKGIDLGMFTSTVDPTLMSERSSLVRNYQVDVGSLVVREEADIEKISQRLYDLTQQSARTQGLVGW